MGKVDIYNGSGNQKFFGEDCLGFKENSVFSFFKSTVGKRVY